MDNLVKRIEFMGLPGSGKTTLCNMVASEIQIQNKKVDNFHQLFKSSLNNQYSKKGSLTHIRYIFINILLRGSYTPLKDYDEQVSKFIIDNNKVWKDIMELTLLNEDVTRRRYIIKNIMITIAKWGIVNKSVHGERYMIMDEGLTNRFFTMNLPINHDEVNSFINRIYNFFEYPDVVINIKCEVGCSMDRMKKRGRGVPESFRMLSAPELESKLEKINKFSEELIAILEKGGTKVISISNNNLIDTKDKIIKELINIYH